MGAGRITRPILLALVLAAAGCDDHAAERGRLEREQGFWLKERQYLAVHQSNLAVGIVRELGGRRPETLSPQEQFRVQVLGNQLDETGRRLTAVDARLESLQQQLWDLDHSPP